jgi:hypothetical protein
MRYAKKIKKFFFGLRTRSYRFFLSIDMYALTGKAGHDPIVSFY